MKNIKYLSVVGLALILGFTACSPEFLDRKPTTAISNDTALSNVSNVRAATVGLMAYFTGSGYAGRNLQVIGDLITDNLTTSSGNSGHLLDIEIWNISSSLGDASSFWTTSYRIASASAKVIQACDKLSNGASSADLKVLQKCKASALTVKAFAEYIITQYYCLPYSAAGSQSPFSVGGANQMNGIILVPMDQPVASENAIDSKSTLYSASLEATYAQMHNELNTALALFRECGDKDFSSSNAAYFPSLCMAHLLNARLYLEQSYGDESNKTALRNSAIASARAALDSLPSGADKLIENNGQKFVEQYRTISSPTKEDILTVNFTAADNLSANSINNMFGSYGCKVSSGVLSLYKNGTKDIRKPIHLTSNEDKKLEIYSSCGKYPNQNQINNVPVLRVPELYLIIAEASAENGVDNSDYRDAMLKTLGRRDTSINGKEENYQKLKELYLGTGDRAALDLVLDERRREFVAEGHRWFDLRRTRTPLTRNAIDFRINFESYPIYMFALPIPESETNTGAWKNGMLKQNEAWQANGDSWSVRYQLPVDGGKYN